MTYEGLARTFSPEALWPQSEEWGRHDFTQRGAQRGATFNVMMEHAFGKPADAREFGSLAQWINYDGYRAMFESGAKYRQGFLRRYGSVTTTGWSLQRLSLPVVRLANRFIFSGMLLHVTWRW